MYNHQPKNYKCPFCFIVRGISDKNVYTNQKDIVYKDNFVTAFIASHWWQNNPGHIIIICNKHIENIYDLPERLMLKIHKVEKMIAIAFKAVYKCAGVSSRQHNEPEGGQDVWHYHLHVFPRYKNDNLYINIEKRKLSNDNEREAYAKKIKIFLQNL